ncbi:MAG: DUF2283 domain-containing protein [Nanobdellota archaeon]
MRKFNFSYDVENDDLLLFRPRSKSKGSVELGDIVFDYDSKKEFVGIQIVNASKFLREITGERSRKLKEILTGLESCMVKTTYKGNLMIVRLELLSKSNDKINPVFSIPRIAKSSPSIAEA